MSIFVGPTMRKERYGHAALRVDDADPRILVLGGRNKKRDETQNTEILAKDHDPALANGTGDDAWVVQPYVPGWCEEDYEPEREDPFYQNAQVTPFLNILNISLSLTLNTHTRTQIFI
ncbi:hypothetical protein M885DRAFT_497114 [Pelagophyceae sp. CCMP2097]|nr:hypothetical protein M885DRAFT_497114 [Pelagophyceae sp. CCMP2097]